MVRFLPSKSLYQRPADQDNKTLLMSNKCALRTLQGSFQKLFQQNDPQEVPQEILRWPGGTKKTENIIASTHPNVLNSLYLIRI